MSKSWHKEEEKGSLWGIKFVLFVHASLGRRCLTFVLYIITFYYSLFSLKAKASHLQYKETLYDYCKNQSIRPPKFSYFSHIFSFASSMLDKVSVWRKQIQLDNIHTPDREKLSSLAKEKNGAVFISAHFGNIEVSRALGYDNPYNKKFHAIVYTENAVKFNNALKSIQPEVSLNTISVKNFDLSTAIHLKSLVDNGDWLFIMGDRLSIHLEEAYLEEKLLGKTAKIPMGPFLLSYLMECPVYSFFCYKLKDKFHIHTQMLANSEMRAHLKRKNWIDQVSKNYLEQLNSVIVKAPTQWYNFFKFWNEKT